MAVSPPPAPSSIDLSGLPPRVVEAAARVLALCREELRSEPRPEVPEEVELRVREATNEFARDVMGAVIENRDDGASRIERDGQSWFRVAVTAGEPFHFENRPGVLRCRKCRQNTGLTVGTVMERSHTPLNVWFWAAYLVASQTPGMSAVQFQRQLGLSRYETAFQILHKLRSGMVRPNQDRIGGQPKNHVEVDETWVGGRTRGEGRGVHHKVPVSCAIEVRHRKPGTKLDNRKDGRYAGRVRLAVVLDRSAESLCGFVESTVAPRSLIVTDDWSGYAGLGKRGYTEALSPTSPGPRATATSTSCRPRIPRRRRPASLSW